MRCLLDTVSMTTTFTLEDDKEMVQLASAHVDAGTRMAWADIAQRAAYRLQCQRSTAVAPSDAKKRGEGGQASSRRCNGHAVDHPGWRVSWFNMFTLRNSDSAEQDLRCNNKARLEMIRCGHSVQVQVLRYAHLYSGKQLTHNVIVLGSGPSNTRYRLQRVRCLIFSHSSTSNVSCVCRASINPRASSNFKILLSLKRQRVRSVKMYPDVTSITQSADAEDMVGSLSESIRSVSSPGLPEEDGSPPMPLSSGERAVAAFLLTFFAKRLYKAPATCRIATPGISTLLRELGGLDRNDTFLDIGSRVGNVVAQVALATSVNKVIEIEIRHNFINLGMKMMAKHTMFEPQVVEIVKEGISKTLLLKITGEFSEFLLKALMPVSQPVLSSFKIKESVGPTVQLEDRSPANSDRPYNRSGLASSAKSFTITLLVLTISCTLTALQLAQRTARTHHPSL
ncbi:Histone methylation protein DOT1 [Phytophthora infestans]|uniref:Histone methylation protein DOT1 n=1 Tax=Phytophthora infestans TaxID=4787 RepID=A0A833T9E7_PHYIN|nr:Histone methylation protein DOT1 [Phytophthora infestans]